MGSRMTRLLNYAADLTFLVVSALSVIGAFASTYRIMTQWRLGWVLW